MDNNDLARAVIKVADTLTIAAKKPIPNAPRLVRISVVVVSLQSGTPNTITVNILGDPTDLAGVKYYNGYSPTPGDTAFGFWQGSDLIIEDKLSGT